MRWLLRPALLAVLFALLLVGAAAVVFQARPALHRATPLAVANGEQEIAWLYPATSATTWERFVAAVRLTAERLNHRQPGWRAIVGPGAFPRQTVSVPEVTLASPAGRRLVFRWYKVTNDWKLPEWVEALVARAPPPIAFIGGNTSNAAGELAQSLAAATRGFPESARPLLLLTTATADRVGNEALLSDADPSEGEELNSIYPGRTFRFCFTNRQMAAAVSDFIWNRDDLRPDTDPIHMVRWRDDAYSRDLVDGFWAALRALVARETATDWGWLTGCAARGGTIPFAGGIVPLSRLGHDGSNLRMSQDPLPQLIDSSVGTFHSPNRFEAEAARYLIADLHAGPMQRRPLLIVPGQASPSRRFLRSIARSAPLLAGRCVVATGDTISFNTIYRDGLVAWPIQDLPFSLVLFCHQSPIDAEAGFRPLQSGDDASTGASATGTEDLLLYGSIVEALARTAGSEAGDPAGLASRLLDLRLDDEGQLRFSRGVPFFTADGNRRPATGEHVVCLLPRIQDRRILPEATIEVWNWRADASPAWRRVGEPLPMTYDHRSAALGWAGGASEGSSP